MNSQSPNQVPQADSTNQRSPIGQAADDANCSPLVDYYVLPQNVQPIESHERPTQRVDQLQRVAQQLSGHRAQQAANPQNSAHTTPVNQRYLTANVASTTPGSKPNFDGQRGSQRNISKFQAFSNQAPHVAQFGGENEAYPVPNPSITSKNDLSGDSAFQNYYSAALQRTPNSKNPDVYSGRNSFQKASEGTVAGPQHQRQSSNSSNRKKQLHENDLDNLKSTLAHVQNQLPDSIQARQSSEKKHSAQAPHEPPQGLMVPQEITNNFELKDSQKKIQPIRKYQPALGNGETKHLPAPGDDRLWRTKPLDRLAAHRKAQKVFVPRSQRRKSKHDSQSPAKEQKRGINEFTSQNEQDEHPVVDPAESDYLEDQKRKTEEIKLRNMQLFNKSRSNSPRVNQTESRSESRSRKEENFGATLDRNHCQASTVEFEAKKEGSSFSSDSDFDRNMDEMESDLMNEQVRPKDRDLKINTNLINEIIKEERYEESHAASKVSASKVSPTHQETAYFDFRPSPHKDKDTKAQKSEHLFSETKSPAADSQKQTSKRLKEQKSLDQYISDLQKMQKGKILSSGTEQKEIDPKQLTEILKKNDEIQKEQAKRDELIVQIQKSLDLRNELLIKYRIESDDHRDQMNQFKSLEKLAKLEVEKESIKMPVILKEPASHSSPDEKQRPKRLKTSRKSESARKSKGSNRKPSFDVYKQLPMELASGFDNEYFPGATKPTEVMSKDKLNNFLQRQQKYDKNKQKKIEREKQLKEEQDAKELVFHPNLRGKRTQSAARLPQRTVEDFLNDQNRFLNKKQSKIDSARRQKAKAEEALGKQAKGMSQQSKKILLNASKKKMKRKRSIQLSINAPKTTRAKHTYLLTGDRSSNADDSMDEGLVVKYIQDQDDASMKSNSIDDVDEHPKEFNAGHRKEFVNKFGFPVEVVNSVGNTEHLASQSHEQAPLLQNKIGGISIQQNPLTNKGGVLDQTSNLDQARIPLTAVTAIKKPQLSNLFVPQKFDTGAHTPLTQRNVQRPLFQESCPSNSGDDFVLKNQVINQIMKQERHDVKYKVNARPAHTNTNSIQNINQSSQMNTNLAQKNAMSNYFTIQGDSNNHSRQPGMQNAELKLRSMSDLNFSKRPSFVSHAAVTAPLASNQNTFRKVLQHEEDDDLYDDICFTSSDDEQPQQRKPKKQVKQSHNRNKTLKSQKRLSSQKRGLSCKSSNYSSNSHKKGGRVNSSPSSARNMMNKAVSENLYYKRALVPGKTTQAATLYSKHAVTQRSTSQSIDIPSFVPKSGRNLDNKRRKNFLNSLQNFSEQISPNKMQKPSLRARNPNAYDPESYMKNKLKKPVNSNTEKMLLKKFNKEFMAAVSTVTGQERIPIKIDCYQFVMLLVNLGAIQQCDIENRHSFEYKKVEEMWLSLLKTSQHPIHGEVNQEEDKIYVGDSKLMLLASFGIKGNRRMDVPDKGQAAQQQEQYPDDILQFGWLANVIDIPADGDMAPSKKQYQLFLSTKDVNQIRKQFDLLYMNRMNTIGRNIQEKKKQKAAQEYDQMKFKPNLQTQKMNAKLLERVHEANQANENKPLFDQLLTQKRPVLRSKSTSRDQNRQFAPPLASQSKWREQREQQLKLKEMKEMENCTFRPDIQKTTDKYKNNSSTYFSANLSNMAAKLPGGENTSGSELRSESKDGDSVFGKKKMSTMTAYASQRQVDLDGQDRFDQLYMAGQAHFQARKILAQQSLDERDFEKQKSECTFRPQIRRNSKPPKTKQMNEDLQHTKQSVQGIFQEYKGTDSSQQLNLERNQSEEDDYQREPPKTRIQQLQQQSVQDAIERQKLANKQKEYIDQCKKQGKIARLFKKQSKPASEDMTPTEKEAKIKTVTERLNVAKKAQDTLKQKYARSDSTSQKRKFVHNSQMSQKRPQVPQVPAGLRVKDNTFKPVLQSDRSRDRSPPIQKEQMPMMYVDVFVDSDGEPIKHRIPVYRGDQADQIAEQFCIKHGYDFDTQDNLEESLRQKIGEVVTKIGGQPNKTDSSHVVDQLETILNQLPGPQYENDQQTNQQPGRLDDGGLQQIPEMNELNQDLEKSASDELPMGLVEAQGTDPDEVSLIDDQD